MSIKGDFVFHPAKLQMKYISELRKKKKKKSVIATIQNRNEIFTIHE